MANAKKINEIKIVMLGASGTGKTSLLTAMYDQFANVSVFIYSRR